MPDRLGIPGLPGGADSDAAATEDGDLGNRTPVLFVLGVVF